MGMIIDFQKKYGLTADGKIGKLTLLKIKEVLKIATNEELANFMGQCDHESNEFNSLYENLNYSATALLNTFHKYFTPESAAKYQRQPEKIANHVYANRMGNGDENSGDGWLHKGVGPIQLTGKLNHIAFATYIKDPEVKTNPSLIATKYPFESAKFFFDTNNLWNKSITIKGKVIIPCNNIDTLSITLLSKAINLGSMSSPATPIGLDERIERTQHYYNLLK